MNDLSKYLDAVADKEAEVPCKVSLSSTVQNESGSTVKRGEPNDVDDFSGFLSLAEEVENVHIKLLKVVNNEDNTSIDEIIDSVEFKNEQKSGKKLGTHKTKKKKLQSHPFKGWTERRNMKQQKMRLDLALGIKQLRKLCYSDSVAPKKSSLKGRYGAEMLIMRQSVKVVSEMKKQDHELTNEKAALRKTQVKLLKRLIKLLKEQSTRLPAVKMKKKPVIGKKAQLQRKKRHTASRKFRKKNSFIGFRSRTQPVRKVQLNFTPPSSPQHETDYSALQNMVHEPDAASFLGFTEMESECFPTFSGFETPPDLESSGKGEVLHILDSYPPAYTPSDIFKLNYVFRPHCYNPVSKKQMAVLKQPVTDCSNDDIDENFYCTGQSKPYHTESMNHNGLFSKTINRKVNTKSDFFQLSADALLTNYISGSRVNNLKEKQEEDNPLDTGKVRHSKRTIKLPKKFSSSQMEMPLPTQNRISFAKRITLTDYINSEWTPSSERQNIQNISPDTDHVKNVSAEYIYDTKDTDMVLGKSSYENCSEVTRNLEKRSSALILQASSSTLNHSLPFQDDKTATSSKSFWVRKRSAGEDEALAQKVKPALGDFKNHREQENCRMERLVGTASNLETAVTAKSKKSATNYLLNPATENGSTSSEMFPDVELAKNMPAFNLQHIKRKLSDLDVLENLQCKIPRKQSSSKPYNSTSTRKHSMRKENMLRNNMLRANSLPLERGKNSLEHMKVQQINQTTLKVSRTFQKPQQEVFSCKYSHQCSPSVRPDSIMIPCYSSIQPNYDKSPESETDNNVSQLHMLNHFSKKDSQSLMQSCLSVCKEKEDLFHEQSELLIKTLLENTKGARHSTETSAANSSVQNSASSNATVQCADEISEQLNISSSHIGLENSAEIPMLLKHHRCPSCDFSTTKLGVFKRHQLTHSERYIPSADTGNAVISKHVSPIKTTPVSSTLPLQPIRHIPLSLLKQRANQARQTELLKPFKDRLVTGQNKVNLKSWSKKDKIELLWCYYYSCCDVFPCEEFHDRLKSVLRKRGKLDEEKMSKTNLLNIAYAVLSSNKLRVQDIYPIKINAEVTARRERVIAM